MFEPNKTTTKIKYCLVNSKGEPRIEFSHSKMMFEHLRNQEARHGKFSTLIPARIRITTEIEQITENDEEV